MKVLAGSVYSTSKYVQEVAGCEPELPRTCPNTTRAETKPESITGTASTRFVPDNRVLYFFGGDEEGLVGGAGVAAYDLGHAADNGGGDRGGGVAIVGDELEQVDGDIVNLQNQRFQVLLLDLRISFVPILRRTSRSKCVP